MDDDEYDFVEEDGSIILFKRFPFHASYQRPSFSLPDPLMFYITKHICSQKVQEKLIQSCKYFFYKNPIRIISNDGLLFRYNQWQTQFKGECISLRNQKSSIWGIHVIEIPAGQKFVLSNLPNFFQCDIAEMGINDQNISITDLKILGSKCQSIWFFAVAVMNKDGTVVPLEKIIEALPKLEYLYFMLSYENGRATITSKTVKELLKIPHFYNLTYLGLYCIPQHFDIETFYDYIKKNKKTKLSLEYEFNEDIFEEEKTNRLQSIVNEILADSNRDYNAPHLHFPGCDSKLCSKLWELANPE